MTRPEAVLVSLGANLGERRDALCDSIGRIAALTGMRLLGTSALYATAPVGGPPGQGEFLNASVLFEAEGVDPRWLLDQLLDIERQHGRVRTVPNGPRTLDLDILLFGDRIVAEEGLSIPHRRMHERSFVLVPAADAAGDLVHPALHRSMADLCRAVGNEGVRRVEDAGWHHAVGHANRR